MKLKSVILWVKRRCIGFNPVAAGAGSEPEGEYPQPAAGPTRPEKGQSLVETAIVLPLMLLLLLGVFEVGWALRGYLVLVNVNREATRFAARGIYLDPGSQTVDPTSTCAFDNYNDPFGVGYCKVISHTNQSLSEQLAMDYLNISAESNASMIMTYYEVEPRAFHCEGDPTCAVDDGYPEKGFDCDRFAYENRAEAKFVPGYDLVNITYPILDPPDYKNDPALPAFYKQTGNDGKIAEDDGGANDFVTGKEAYHYHRGINEFSRIDPAEKVAELRSQSNVINCQLVKKGQPPAGNSVIIVENTYFQDLLVGGSFITSWIGEGRSAVPLYTHTAMRVTTNVRQAATEEDQACNLVPIIVGLTRVQGKKPGQTLNVPFGNDSAVPGSFGFLQWDGSPGGGATDLKDSIKNPSTDSYSEPKSTPPDEELNIGDWLMVETGAIATAKDPLKNYVAPMDEFLIPIWDDTQCGGGPHDTCNDNADDGSGFGGVKSFKTLNFIRVRIKNNDPNNIKFTGSPKKILFEFLGYADSGVCKGNGR